MVATFPPASKAEASSFFLKKKGWLNREGTSPPPLDIASFLQSPFSSYCHRLGNRMHYLFSFLSPFCARTEVQIIVFFFFLSIYL